MIVASFRVGFCVPAFVTVVAPIKVIPFVIIKHEVQEAVPAGTTTVSPSEAAATAVLTSISEGLAAMMLAALVRPAIINKAPASAINTLIERVQARKTKSVLIGRMRQSVIISIVCLADAMPRFQPPRQGGSHHRLGQTLLLSAVAPAI